MLTIFTCPLPFEGHRGIIQHNAIKSWINLDPSIEIILTGNEDYIQPIADSYDIDYLTGIDCNEYGTPLINSIFNKVIEKSKNDILCYINSDIIITNYFLSFRLLIDQLEDNFLFIGKRHDLNITDHIDFSLEWEKKYFDRCKNDNLLHASTGKDYFIFNKELYKNIPSFAIGRGAWDDWLVYYADKIGAMVIDATSIFFIIHQNHDYSHLKTGDNPFKSIESKNNNLLAGNTLYRTNGLTIDDASYFVLNNKIKKKSRLYLVKRKIINLLSPFYMIMKRLFTN